MPGRVVQRMRFAQLTSIGEQNVLDAYVQVGSVDKLLTALGLELSRDGFYTWLKSRPGLWERWKDTRELLADKAAEEVRTIANDVTDNNDVPIAKLRVDAAKWTAEQFNRGLYGKQGTTVNVAVAVGNSWLSGIVPSMIDKEPAGAVVLSTARGEGRRTHTVELQSPAPATTDRMADEP